MYRPFKLFLLLALFVLPAPTHADMIAAPGSLEFSIKHLSEFGDRDVYEASIPYSDKYKRFQILLDVVKGTGLNMPDQAFVRVLDSQEKEIFRARKDDAVIGFEKAQVFTIKYGTLMNHRIGEHSIQQLHSSESKQAVLIQEKIKRGGKIRAVGLIYDEGQFSQQFDIKCDRCELSDLKGDGVQEVVCYPFLGNPVVLSPTDSIDRSEPLDANSWHNFFNQYGDYPGLTDDAEKKAEALIAANPGKKSTELYLAHRTLAVIYGKRASKLGRDEWKRSNDEYALAFQAQDLVPFKEKPDEGLGIDGFRLLRRAYKTEGISSYENYDVNSSGQLTLQHGPTLPVGVASKKAWDMKSNNGFDATNLISSSKKYQVNINDQGDDQGWLEVTDLATENQHEVIVPDEGWSWRAIGWLPNRDLYYFVLTQGANTDRGDVLWQYDPTDDSLKKVGLTGSIFLSPNKKWILWSRESTFESIGDKTVGANRINIFNVEKCVNYEIAPGVSDNIFLGWNGQ
jgi:hypothetical protein